MYSNFVNNKGTLFSRKSSFLPFRNFDDDGFIQLHSQVSLILHKKYCCLHLRDPSEISVPFMERWNLTHQKNVPLETELATGMRTGDRGSFLCRNRNLTLPTLSIRFLVSAHITIKWGINLTTHIHQQPK